MIDFDLVIVGAGPAGLAAAVRMSGSGQRVALIDGGKPITQRDRHDEAEITRGHGGAGLFSDGKFSFFPSASELWSLTRGDDLRAAFDWTCAVLGEAGLQTPPYPSDPTALTVDCGEWVLKDYPSDYLSLPARLQLTRDMVASLDAEILTETDVVSVQYDATQDHFDLALRDGSRQRSALTARRLLVASGRFGPLGLREPTRHRSFTRLEVGLRIEQAADRAFFRHMRQLDPKLRFRESSGDVEWRTFCACRDGDAVLTETQGLWTVSGHSDGPPTGRSNVGFNTRILNESVAKAAFGPALSTMADKDRHFVLRMTDLLAGESSATATLDAAYGKPLRKIMTCGLGRLATAFPDVDKPETRLIGPTLEGVGWYPTVNGDLRLLDAPAWVVGDACGLFRGIVAAMISGHYGASAVLAEQCVW